MGNFANNAITEAGRALLADVQSGAVFTPTRIVMGSGSMPAGTTTRNMTNVIAPVKSLAITKKVRTPDGKCIFGGVYTNEEITAAFYFRELALYAKAVYLNEDGSVQSEGAETLYSYGNAGDTADYMPAYSTSTVVERNMDLVTWVGNDAQVDLTIESEVYLTQGQAVLNMQRINPTTVGYDTILEYMSSIYDQNLVVSGLISGFADMPEDVVNLHGTINVVGGQLTVFGNARTSFYYRGTNSRTAWTSEWRRLYDGTTDVTIEKTAAAVRMKTQNGVGSIYKNANATIDNGVVIADETKDGELCRVNLSSTRTLTDKLRLIIGDDDIYYILHSGNISIIKPEGIGAVNKTGDTMNGDLTVERPGAGLHLKTPIGKARIYKNANDSDFGTLIYDETDGGKTATLIVSAARTLAKKLELSVDGNFYTVLHTGNLSTFGLGAVDATVE